MKPSIHIILPCAGKGNRLGLNYPKELYEIRPNVRLIDFSLAHIRFSLIHFHLEISVIISPGKESVFEYIKEIFPKLKVNCVYFNELYKEWPGSIYSASGFFKEYNLVILPDTLVSLSSSNPFYDEIHRSLLQNLHHHLVKCDWILGVKKPADTSVLKYFGACYQNKENQILLFEDKPLIHIQSFNAFWGVMGFRKNIGSELYQFLIDSVFKNNSFPYQNCSFYPASSFCIENYIDFGRWEEIHSPINREAVDQFLQYISI